MMETLRNAYRVNDLAKHTHPELIDQHMPPEKMNYSTKSKQSKSYDTFKHLGAV